MADPATWFVAILGGLAMARYAPTSRENLLKNQLRKQILELVEACPGIARVEVAQALGCVRATVSHHVSLLAEERFLRAVRVGRKVRLFPIQADEKVVGAGFLKRGRMLDFARAIVERPGAKQAEVARVANVSRKVLGPYVRELVEMGLIQENRTGGQCQYRPTQKLVQIVAKLDEQEFLAIRPR